jgi:hypothetical protein
MTDPSLTWRCAARRTGPRAEKQPQPARPRVEELEGRVVPSYFPSTTDGIHIIEDQLPGGLSSAMVRFVATHTDGTQKETLGTTNQFRAINPDYTVLHYQLGTGNSAYDYIIRSRVEKTVRKGQRGRLGNWSFAQLRHFLEYKARLAGVPLVTVDPRHTSQTCSACGHRERANRKSQAEFVCKHCGYSLDADHNGARNIRSRALGASVNGPDSAAAPA